MGHWYDRDEETARRELAEIKDIERIEREEGSADWRALLAPWVRPILIVGFGLATFQQIMRINTISYYAPTTLTRVGFEAEAAVLANVSIGVMNIVAVLVAIRYADGALPRHVPGELGLHRLGDAR